MKDNRRKIFSTGKTKLLKNVQANDESGDTDDGDRDFQGGGEGSEPRWEKLGHLSQQLLDLGDDCRHGWVS